MSEKEHLRVPFFLFKIREMNYFNKKNNTEQITVHTLFEWIDSLVCAAVLCILFFTFVCKTMRIIGSSMYPTYIDGQRVFAITPFSGIHAGDVVVTDNNNGTGDPLIKRVIAVSGDELFIDDNGTIFINGNKITDYVDLPEYTTYGDTEYPIVIPEGMVFLMGDNREVSLDSRYIRVGCIPYSNIVGKVIS